MGGKGRPHDDIISLGRRDGTGSMGSGSMVIFHVQRGREECSGQRDLRSKMVLLMEGEQPKWGPRWMDGIDEMVVGLIEEGDGSDWLCGEI